MRTVIIKAPKPVSFDLSFTKTNENTKILEALNTLKANAGWHFLTQVFEENIKYLAHQIITKRGDDNQELKDADVDLLRFKHSYLSELLKKPDHFLKELTRTDQSENDLDPYEKRQE